MTGIIITILITAFAAWSSFIPETGKVTDGRSKGVKFFTKKGRIIIAINIAIIALSVAQYCLNKSESEDQERKSKLEKERSDLILKKRNDSIIIELKRDNINTVTVFTETLAKFGLRTDSVNNKLVRIVKDSSRIEVSEIQPILDICNDNGIAVVNQKINSMKYEISICSKEASSTNFKVNLYIILADSTGRKRYSGLWDILPKDTKISMNDKHIRSFTMDFAGSYTSLILYANGTYTDINGLKNHTINQVYYYDLKTKQMGVLFDNGKKAIMDFIRTNKKNLGKMRGTQF